RWRARNSPGRKGLCARGGTPCDARLWHVRHAAWRKPRGPTPWVLGNALPVRVRSGRLSPAMGAWGPPPAASPPAPSAPSGATFAAGAVLSLALWLAHAWFYRFQCERVVALAQAQGDHARAARSAARLQALGAAR